MSPRHYRLGQRQAATEQTRARIIAATRALLLAGTGFSLDAVARAAGVARMTVYYQFDSKRGLLEALMDDLADRAQIGRRLAVVFAQSEPLDALMELIAAFAHFWETDRLIIRRIRGLAALDLEFEQGIRTRDEFRRTHLRRILPRLTAKYGRPAPDALDEAIDILQMLTSPETFDTLAGASRSPEDVAPLVQRLARAALNLDDA